MTVQSNTRVKNRIKAHLAFNGIQIDRDSSYWSGDFIGYLRNLPLDDGPSKSCLNIYLDELEQHRQRLANVLKELKSCIRQRNTGWIIDNIRSVPGIGFKTAMILYTEIMDIHRFKNLNHLKSYAGLVPSIHSSGETDRTGGLTHRRNSHLRYVLIESAWVAIRKDPVLLQTYHRLSKRMQKQEAIIRIASKLLSRIRYVWMNDCPYVPGVIQ
jgi:transposase